MEKIICAQCGKEDFKECVIKDGKTFCCAVCSESYTKAHEKDKKEDAEDGVCKFC